MGADDLISSGHLLLLYYFEQPKSILAMNTYPRLTVSGSKYNTPNGCDKAPKGRQHSPKGRHHSGFLSFFTMQYPKYNASKTSIIREMTVNELRVRYGVNGFS